MFQLRRGFSALLGAQFLGALNDNAFKILLNCLITRELVTQTSGSWYLGLAGFLFTLPFIVLSPYAGVFADRFRKSDVIRVSKLLEVCVAFVAIPALNQQNLPLLFILIFFMGVHSTLFSPAKYGVMPEILRADELSKGNGVLEFCTFFAILVGTAFGSLLFPDVGESFSGTSKFFLFVSLLGLLFALGIPKTEAKCATLSLPRNPFRDLHLTLSEIRQSRSLFLAMLAIGYFWFLGALFQTNFFLYAGETLKLSESHVGILLAVFSVGIGVGSIVAGIVSAGKVELGLVPLGAGGVGILSMLLPMLSTSTLWTVVVLFGMGVCSGVFYVPLSTFFQRESPAQSRGRFLAANNVVSYSAMGLAFLVFAFVTDLCKANPKFVFILQGVLSLAVTVIMVRVMPAMLIRCINWVVSHAFYSLRVVGRENIPQEGGALLVCNHVSFADPALILASVERPVRFVMYRAYYELPVVHMIAKALGTIPISPADGPRAMLKSLDEARQAIEHGELVCIFAEGAITRIGQLLPFSRGLERIVKGLSAPVVPIYLDQMWGSIFSFRGGRFIWKLPREIPYPVTLMMGNALAPSGGGNVTAQTVRETVQQLSTQAVTFRHSREQMLHLSFLQVAKKFPWRWSVSDSSGLKLRYGEMLALVIAVSQKLKHQFRPGTRIGIVLPPSVAGAIANVAAEMAGLVPVNLNYTSGKDALRSAVSRAEITHTFTSKAFLEKLSVDDSEAHFGQCAFVEEYFQIPKEELWKWGLLGLLLPGRVVQWWCGIGNADPNSLATVIFSSGSTAEPKGVMLSHGNIASNIEALYDVFQLRKDDAFVGVLPFFHSFGYTGTLWLPLLAGLRVTYHPNPMDAAGIGEIVHREHAKIFLSTPTFLLSYMRRCSREQFESLRYLVVGAEKLRDKVARAFEEKFGILPLEGYGCTELSPVAALNIQDYDSEDVNQTGRKIGTVGHPIPGVAAKVVDPETFTPLSADKEGLLLIKGPNVMQGYLGMQEKTTEVIRDGWYITGDIARIDEEGFITLTDRLSRFSKIGGEMVPHGKIEEALQRIVKRTEPVCVVTAVPDERKGEKLVVLHTIEIDVPQVVKELASEGLPNLWIPKTENFLLVSELPLLGSGKLDLRGAKLIAEKQIQGETLPSQVKPAS